METARHPIRLLALAFVLAVALVGCSSGPGEEQLLPEKDLAFPRATVTARKFEEEYHGTKLDGGSVDTPARLYTAYRADPGTAFSEVQAWYREQLGPKGWQVGPTPPDDNYIEFVRTSDGYDHKIQVYRPGGPPELYDVDYEIRERP